MKLTQIQFVCLHPPIHIIYHYHLKTDELDPSEPDSARNCGVESKYETGDVIDWFLARQRSDGNASDDADKAEPDYDNLVQDSTSRTSSTDESSDDDEDYAQSSHESSSPSKSPELTKDEDCDVWALKSKALQKREIMLKVVIDEGKQTIPGDQETFYIDPSVSLV